MSGTEGDQMSDTTSAGRTIHCAWTRCSRPQATEGDAESLTGWLALYRMDDQPGSFEVDPGPWRFCARDHLVAFVSWFEKP